MPPNTGKRKIYLVLCKKQYKLAATFMRFQEYYESPRFKGQIFSIEEYMDWYAEERGNFTYFQDWGGFNIPSWVLQPFYKGKFDPLTEKKAFLELFRGLIGDFYIIGATWDTKKREFENTVKHEFVHGLFFTEAEYRQKVVEELKKHNTSRIEHSLSKIGYAPSVYYDEMNAYLLTGAKSLEREGAPRSKITKLTAVVKRVFEEHFGYVVSYAKIEDILKKVHLLRL